MSQPSFTISDTHPALAGHFPDHPIVPGVVILEKITDYLLQQYPTKQVVGFSNVKFLAPLLPNQTVCLSHTEKENMCIVIGHVNEQLLLKAQVQVEQV